MGRDQRVGCFDTVHEGERIEQVKLWGTGLRWVHVGDVVGAPRGGLAPGATYTMAMRSGGYVHVVGGVIKGWRDEPGPKPLLTTGGDSFDPADWPNGDFGPWYFEADMPARVRRDLWPSDPCEACTGSKLRAVKGRDGVGARHRAEAERLVEKQLEADLDEEIRLALAQKWLAHGGSLRMDCAVAARLLEAEAAPVVAGRRLQMVLASIPVGDPAWQSTAAFVGFVAKDLSADDVRKCLRMLANALPEQAHSDDVITWLRSYKESDFREAAEEAVRAHGADVLAAIPLRFWAQDVAAPSLMQRVIERAFGRRFTADESGALSWALLDLAGYLEGLSPERLHEALTAKPAALAGQQI